MGYPRKLKVQALLGCAFGLIALVGGLLLANELGGILALVGFGWMALSTVAFTAAGNWDEKVAKTGYRRRAERFGRIVTLGVFR
jgi:hypothetical protein